VLTFTPSTGFTPLSEITLTVPGGSSGIVAVDGARLAQSVVEQFRVANGSVLRLQQMLSLLDYSPLAWTSVAPLIASNDTAAQSAALYAPPVGTFSWRNPGWPRQLRAQWAPGEYNVFTRGLVMSFQADHGLATNGHVGPALWTALIGALAANTVNTGGYDFALANKASPQTLTIFHDGHVVLKSPANTGIAGSPTPDGTFPVNTRLRRQVMRGTNPNGQAYADLVQYIAYFHGNDAVHYMDRADYGIPQSLGCIELPLADAARAWPYLAYGTLVTVIN
jgi:peptidoglycan hydrolase-like protein with peptidoglycan-binding domain